MSDNHQHHQHQVADTLTKSFAIGILLNIGFVIVELVAGMRSNSLALLSDAWHNVSDVSSLAISFIVLKLSRKKANNKYTYGYHKGTILGALASAVILLIAVGSIGWEAIQRFYHPETSSGAIIGIVAATGIVVNTLSALLFFKHRDKELNARAAYLHLMMDALVSAGVVVSGILIYKTGWQWLDPLTSLVIMLVLIYSSIQILLESFSLSMDAVPPNVNLDEIKNTILKNAGVEKVYHMHVWALSTTRNAMTAHLVMKKDLSVTQIDDIKKNLRHELEHLQVEHVTFETEMREN